MDRVFTPCDVCRTAQVMRTLQFYDRQRYDEKNRGTARSRPSVFLLANCINVY
mgnify:CR=1 FL=1